MTRYFARSFPLTASQARPIANQTTAAATACGTREYYKEEKGRQSYEGT